MIFHAYRCTECNDHFATVTGPCPVCESTDRWEPCVVDDTPPDTTDSYLVHPSGVAFFAYDEAAKIGVPAPDWVAAHIPQDSAQKRRDTIESRIRDAIAQNSTYLAIGTPTNAQNAAQLKALTRQVQGLLRLRGGVLDALD